MHGLLTVIACVTTILSTLAPVHAADASITAPAVSIAAAPSDAASNPASGNASAAAPTSTGSLGGACAAGSQRCGGDGLIGGSGASCAAAGDCISGSCSNNVCAMTSTFGIGSTCGFNQTHGETCGALFPGTAYQSPIGCGLDRVCGGLGAACSSGYQCASEQCFGYRCTSPSPKIGSACSSYGALCGDGSTCGVDGTCGSGGAYCSVNAQCATTCVSGQCAPAVGSGFGNVCAAGFGQRLCDSKLMAFCGIPTEADEGTICGGDGASCMVDSQCFGKRTCLGAQGCSVLGSASANATSSAIPSASPSVTSAARLRQRRQIVF